MTPSLSRNFVVSALPLEFRERYADATIVVRETPDLHRLSPIRQAKASSSYAEAVRADIAAGRAVVLVSAGSAVCPASPAAIRKQARSTRDSLENLSPSAPIISALASFEVCEWVLEDGSALVEGSLQLPYGELWVQGPNHYTGPLFVAGEDVPLTFRRGRVVGTPTVWRSLVGRPLVELGFGCNSQAERRGPGREKASGIWHVGVGAVSRLHLYPPFVHSDVELDVKRNSEEGR
ncbi:MAG: hypothetical protein CVT62_07615 [Actinobacteria bacterium HGW-Actinobacteria-2]|nr:MAG: hypothetical protein CVT62_07615 [Actinobacteria bacterium HGW-Actinobacteria-2]